VSQAPQTPDVSPLKRAIVELRDLRARLDGVERARTEPIAVIGMGCRFPGNASDPESYWRLLRDGVDTVTEVPAERWDVDAFYDPDPDAPGKMYTRHGAFLSGVDRFDPHFFGVSAREAVSMDPQQRLLLEVAWEALENAGQPAETLLESDTGVFMGIGFGDYMLRPGSANTVDGYFGTGASSSAAAGRLSYFLGLRGPSVALDTACSSSLVATHLACQSLRSGESQLALAGGVNLILSPYPHLTFSKARMLSADGRCKTFDAAADGYGRGEGCGVVVLKRLSQARADRDRVLAVILGTAVNQDGRSGGLTVPNGPAQEALIRRAVAASGLEPEAIGAIEAHGTGTPLGDPIEVRALARALRADRSRAQPLVVGSAKTNLGHLEAAAGVAGLIKAVLSVGHAAIPPHLHFGAPNPHIPWAELSVQVPHRLTPFALGARPVMGVSAFGFTGTNAHVIVAAAEAEDPPPAVADRPLHLLAVSARTESALAAAAAGLAAHLESHPEASLADVAFTTGAGRSHFPFRLAVVAGSSKEAQQRLVAAAGPGVARGRFLGPERPELGFLFTGQGSQYAGMARGLYETQPTFRRALERCAALLEGVLPRPLLAILHPEPGAEARLDETQFTQPALFALEYALAEMWRSWGVVPAAVLGHSLGEYVAACVAGVFSLEDGLRLVAARGRLMQALPAGGQMASVAAGEAQVREVLQRAGAGVDVAALNGPASTVLSGPGEALQAACAAFAADGIASERLAVSHAFHSRLMEPALAAFAEVAQGVAYGAPRLTIVSNLTGRAAGPEIATADYWSRQLREPVRFEAGMQALHAMDVRVFVEIGPQPTLLGLGRRCLPEGAGAFLPSLRRNRADWSQLLESLAALYVSGVEVDWKGYDRDYARSKVTLPTYPFARERYWADAPPAQAAPRDARGGRKRSDVAEWFSVPSWSRSIVRDGVTPNAAGRWLVFLDESGLGEALAARLVGSGRSVATVRAGERFEAPAPGAYVLDPRQPEHYETLLAALRAAGALPERIVHLWSYGPPPAGPDTWDATQDRGFYSLLHLARALSGAAVELNVVTSGVQHVTGDEALVPERATALGPCTVLPQEHPEIACRSLDLETPGAEPVEGMAALLLKELDARAAEPVVAYRHGLRWVQGFEAQRLPAAAGLPARLRERGVYVVTGGLGGVGLELALGLARAAHARLVLVGRQGLPPREQWTGWLQAHGPEDATRFRIEKVLELEGLGAEVLVVAADVADLGQMGAVMARAQDHFGAVHGVLHAAGADKQGRSVAQADRAHCEAQFRPKVAALKVLARVLEGRSLDFCLLTSSLSSVLGVMGFVSYTAAHLFMDAFARKHNRTRPATPWLCVNWDNWETGRTPDVPVEFVMTREEGAEALLRILASGDLGGQLFVSTGPLAQRVEEWVGRRAASDAVPPPPRHARAELSTPYLAPRTERESALAAVFQGVLGLDRVGVDDNFFELGGDSVMAIQIASRATTAGVHVSSHQVLEAQTVAALAALAGSPAAAAESASVASDTPFPAARLDPKELAKVLSSLSRTPRSRP
jgi:acyl transferase domain-containing protein